MPITLGSNIASLRGQNGLNKVTNELRSVYERLSSGMRINRASDDAAGLAVSESLKADTRIYTQGIRNVNDGISLLSIADSALENLSTIVTRLQELAEQASNGVYGAKQREALDAEAQTLAKEFTRIQQSTTFNGISLLNGSLSNLQIQAGIGDSAMLDLGVGGKIGTGTFEDPKIVSSTGSSVSNAMILDLNQDGNQDLISLINASDIIEVEFGVGDGSFTNTTTYSINAGAGSFNIADFNNDGYYDLVTANGTANSIDIRLGNADGSFGSASSIALSERINEIAIGDINGDGKLDIVGSRLGVGTTTVPVLTGNGDGTFQIQNNITTGSPTTDVALADFNNDGILDVAVRASTSNNIQIFNGYGNGTFNSSATIINTGAVTATELLANDLNNDGLIDLVMGDRSAGARIYMNQGNGNFDSGTIYSTGNINNGNTILGDFNGDGFVDIGIGSTTGLAIGINQGNGTFGTARIYDSTTNLNNDLSIGDLNNDGVLDIIAATNASTMKEFLGSTTDGTAPINPFSLKTIADAKQALTQFKKKSNLLSSQRGEIGAYQARLSTANNVLLAVKENFETAGARIREADIAEESAKLVRNNILQQAASSILGQANLQPELVLNLLR